MRDTNPSAPAHTAVAPFTIQRTLKPRLLRGEPWRLPVAHLEENEDLDAGAQRAVGEATGAGDVCLEPLHTFTAPDPAPEVVVSDYTLIPYDRTQIYAEGGEWVNPAYSRPTAPGLRHIIDWAAERLVAKREYAPIANQFLTDQFTLGESPSVCEIIGRRPLDRRNFRRRIRASQHLLKTYDARHGSHHRPTRPYRLRETEPSIRG